MQKSLKSRSLKAVKVVLSGFLSAVLVLYMPVMVFAGDYNIDEGSVDIHARESGTTVTHKSVEHNDDSPKVYSGSENTTHNTITITAEDNTTANVTISNVNIDGRQDGFTTGDAAISVNGTGSVSIELDGNNSLISGDYHAGIEDNLGGQLTIRDDNGIAGSVNVQGGNSASGIGGSRTGEVSQGVVPSDRTGSDIKITGGTVTATGGESAAGIGGGIRGNGTKIEITGGTVTATGGGMWSRDWRWSQRRRK